VWDAATGECVATLRGHSGEVWRGVFSAVSLVRVLFFVYQVNSVAVFPDGRRVVSGADDNTVKVWDAATGECVATLAGHSELVWCGVFSAVFLV
jgi:WD40 repeat protein